MKEKLIRDEIVEYVQRERGETLNTRVATGEELTMFLRCKIVEEALEVSNASNPVELAEELADLMEVMKALAYNQGVVDELFEARERKLNERGGFDKGIILITEDK